MIEKSFLGQSLIGFHRVAYTEWGMRKEQPPVICVHGLTRNGRDFDRLAAILQKNTNVFCPDIVGRGKSDNLMDPTLYTYPQYCADMTALIARIDAPRIDWVGTSMGGLIGMMLAAQPQSPIRRLVINDVGPFISLAALKRIASYVGMVLEFVDLEQLERHMRAIYAPFGITRDEDWHHLAEHGYRRSPQGKFTLAHDPLIARNFSTLDKDADLWPIYDRIQCPTLVLRGINSDILSVETIAEMKQRGPRAQVLEFKDVGHAPALVDSEQIEAIERFLNAPI